MAAVSAKPRKARFGGPFFRKVVKTDQRHRTQMCCPDHGLAADLRIPNETVPGTPGRGRFFAGACCRLTVQKVGELVRVRAVGLSQEISMHKDGKHVVETAVEARGGLLGRPVLLVLLVSCVLAVAALIVTYSGT
jgi:hypothetical protein